MKEIDLKNISSQENDLSHEIKEKENKIINENNIISNLSDENEEDCYNVIAQFTKIKRCSVLKYGVSLSSEKIKFGYCRTCDANLMHQICSECIRECHIKKGHDTREIEQPDFILCGCGERMHTFINNDKKKLKNFQ